MQQEESIEETKKCTAGEAEEIGKMKEREKRERR